MMSVPNQPERTFDVEELQNTLGKLQEAMRMVSQVRRNLEQEEAVAHGGMHSRRFESRLATYSRNLGSVSAYDDERACSSRSLRSSMRSDDHIAQPRRAAKSPNLIARLMGLEETSPMYTSRSEREGYEDVQLAPPPGIKMLRAGVKDTVKTAVSKGLVENNGTDEDCKNIPSSFGTSNSHIRKLGLERKEVKRREKPEAKPLKINSVAALAGVSKQQQERKMSKPLLHGKKPAVKMEKEIAGPTTSEAKGSTRAPVRLDRSSLPKGANAPKRHNLATTRSKKEKEAKAATKYMDIIPVTAGRTPNSGVASINQSHADSLVDTLPNHMELQNSKQCSTGRRGRKDSKHFCEVMVKTTVKGGRNSVSSEAGELRFHKVTTQREEEATAVDFKLLLLSSQSFINYAQGLCRLDGNQITTNHPKKGVLVAPTRNAKLLLDCARELVDRKSMYQALEPSNRHPVWLKRLSSSSSGAIVRVDKLAEEIASEISKLEVRRGRSSSSRRCCGDGEGVNSEDGTYEMLEMDLGCNSVLLNAMWDRGWMEWICVEEVDYVVGPLEKMVLCELVEELVLDLLL